MPQSPSAKCYLWNHNTAKFFWEIADLTAKQQHPTNGHELMMQGMMDGWVMGQDNEPLFWVPIEHRKSGD